MKKTTQKRAARTQSTARPRPQSRVGGKESKPVAKWVVQEGRRLLILKNAFFEVSVWPEMGGAIASYVDRASGLDIIWRNPYCQPARARVLDQPLRSGSDLYDVMDGSWYVSVPNGFFAGDYFGAPLGTHGELRCVPWNVESIVNAATELRVMLVGRSVRTPLVYRRELSVRKASPRLFWTETLQNRSSEALPVSWLQHPTFGGPLLDGAQLLTPARTVRVFQADDPKALQLKAGYTGQWPWVPEREGGKLRDCSVVPPAGSGFDHSVQLTDFTTGCGCVWNDGRQLGFSLEWDASLFPHAWSWSTSGGARNYPMWGEGHIITLQPSTSPVGRFPDLLQRNQLMTIPARGAVSTKMTTGFVTARDDRWTLRKDNV